MKKNKELFTEEELEYLYGVPIADVFLVGLDPGKSTGFCLYNKTRKRIVKLCTLDFWQVFDVIELVFTSYNIAGEGGRKEAPLYHNKIEFVIENSSLNKPTFAKAGDGKELSRQKISRNVGMNQRESVLLIQGIRRLGYEVKEVTPSKKSAYKGKITVPMFKAMTGWKGTSSQHARDAAMLVIQ